MKVKEIMSKKLEWISPDTTIQDAARKMRELNVGSLPVREGKGDGAISGIVTDRDIACRFVTAGGDPSKAKVSDIMTKSIVSCTEDDDVTEAAHLMEAKQLHRLAVYDREKHLKGMLALADIATHVPHELSGEVIEAVSKPASPRSAA
jgi:CBS domain-containing protein